MSEHKADLIRAQELEARELRIPPLIQTLTATFVVTNDMASLLVLDPGGGARNVDMPAEEAVGMEGKLWIVINAADALEVITLRNDAAGTIGTLTQNETAQLMVVGGVWKLLGVMVA